MKKRLLSLLVALCMAVTLLPVSAITAWAEEGGQLKIVDGYPVGSGKNHDENCSGDGWSYDGSTQTLTLDPSTPTTYDLTGRGSIRQDYRIILCSAIIGENATIENGDFGNIRNPGSSITNAGTITSGVYSMPVINHGTITGGTFSSTVTNNGTIKGGIFQKKPEGNQVADGYTLNVNFPENGSYECYDAGINYFGNSGYVIPNSDHNTSITIHIFFRNRQAILFPIDVTFGDTNDAHCLLEDWAPSARYYDNGSGYFSVTFTAPPATAATVTLSMLTRLVIDENGYPVGTKGGTQDYSGNGWKFEKSNNTLTLTSGSYDFSGEKNALRPLNPDVNLVVEPGAKLTGGAAGDGSGVTWQLTENTDDPSTYTLTIRGSGAMEDYLMSSNQPWRSFRKQITSVVVSPGVTSIGNLAFTRFSKLIHVDIADSVVSIGEQAFSDCSRLTDITVPQSVTYIGVNAFDSCTNLSSITLSTNNITSIRSHTFSGCSELSSIVIPDGVTSIQSGAFLTALSSPVSRFPAV